MQPDSDACCLLYVVHGVMHRGLVALQTRMIFVIAASLEEPDWSVTLLHHQSNKSTEVRLFWLYA